jgi:hypothetical protein
MELNKRKSGTKKAVVNPEGSIAYERLPEIQLYLEASNLNLKSDDFYRAANDKLLSIVDKAKKLDSNFLIGLSKFLADGGIKLSPVILLSVLASRTGQSFRDENVSYVFNTPQRIAEAIALQNMKITKLNNSFKKNVLKVSLEGMNQFTLRKNRMSHRKIKLKDLIKLLRPKPKDKEMSVLYRAIIEDTKLSKLKDNETLVSVKSSTNVSDVDKMAYFAKNIDTIPLNQLIRNLKTVENFKFLENHLLQEKIVKRLKSITDFRYLNMFDLIEVALHVPELEKAMVEVIENYVSKIKSNMKIDLGKATLLFDVSGSMRGDGFEKGFKYCVMMCMLYDVDLYFFSTDLIKAKLSREVEYIRKGMLSKAYKSMDDKFEGGGTALIESTGDAISSGLVHETLIIISDEVSWIEGEDLRDNIEELRKSIANKKIVLVNPVVYEGTVFADNLIGIASLTSSLLQSLFAFSKPKEFIAYVKNYRSEK